MISKRICRELVVINRPISARLDGIIGAFDLTLSHWRIVDFINEAGTCTLVEISRHFFIEKPPVTRIVKYLEERLLVEQVSGKDKREKRVRLTGAGKEVYAACRNALDEAETGLLKGLSDEEQGMLLRFLITIRDNLGTGRRCK